MNTATHMITDLETLEACNKLRDLNVKFVGTDADKLRVKKFNQLPRPEKVLEAFLTHCQNQTIEQVGFEYIQLVYGLNDIEIQGLKSLVEFNMESNFELQEVADEYFVPQQFGNSEAGKELYKAFLQEKYETLKKVETRRFFIEFFKNEDRCLNFAILLNCEPEDFSGYFPEKKFLKVVELLESETPFFKSFDKYKEEFEIHCCDEKASLIVATAKKVESLT